MCLVPTVCQKLGLWLGIKQTCPYLVRGPTWGASKITGLNSKHSIFTLILPLITEGPCTTYVTSQGFTFPIFQILILRILNIPVTMSSVIVNTHC